MSGIGYPMRVADFDYELPRELIAQVPAPERDGSRLLVLDSATGAMAHRAFTDLPDLLRPDDLLVLNDTKVIPARLRGRWTDGSPVEVLLLAEGEGGRWDCLVKPARKARPGRRMVLAGGEIGGNVTGGTQRSASGGLGTQGHRAGDPAGTQRLAEGQGRWVPAKGGQPLGPSPWVPGEGRRLLQLEHDGALRSILDRHGLMPLPPYIKRQGAAEPEGSAPGPWPLDRERYQTVYAREEGAVAAPTAGLHFTQRLLAALGQRGIGVAFLTLHAGLGTFKPVRVQAVEEHTMEPERYFIPEETARAIKEAKAGRRRIVAVGTTTVRALEQAADPDGEVRAGAGLADLFIYPGFRFRVVDALITNFHLPRSTLVMLVAAFAGRDRILAAYAEAIRQRYRFYSYGDAMLIQQG